jgi:hypothetical protein
MRELSGTACQRAAVVAGVLCLLGAPRAWALPKDVIGGGGGPIVIGPVEPQPPSAPTLGMSGRTANSLTVVVHDRGNDESGLELQRQGPSGYVTVASWGPLPGTGQTRTFIDSGLPSDTPQRYRARTWNNEGSSYSDQLLLYTKGAGHSVWRAEVILETANVANADTEDSVHVSLNPGNYNVVPHGNSTWLDYARDDFERGHTDSYDLNINSVSELSDITHIYVSKTGDDAWCVRSLALKVNNLQVFSKSFAGLPGGCLWVDDDDGHSLQFAVPFGELRASPEWQGYNHTQALFWLAFFGLPNAELVSRFEGIVGDSIHDTELYWGHLYGPAVEVTRGCPANVAECQTLHVDLDLAASVTGPNPDVDIDFDVNVACTGGNLEINTANFNVEADSSLIWELVTFGLIELLDNAVEDAVKSSFQAIERSISGVGDCKVYVDADAGLRVEQAQPSGRGTVKGGVVKAGDLVKAAKF